MFSRVLLLLVAFAASQSLPTIPTDFTSNITVNFGGIKNVGYIVSQVSAGRYYRFIKELNESTYSFQFPGTVKTYTYTIMNSGCTCELATSTFATDIFVALSTASPNPKGCNSTYGSGQLFSNNDFPGLAGTSQDEFCFNGNTPVYVRKGSMYTIFSNFVAGRPKTFPVSPMDKWIFECQTACV